MAKRFAALAAMVLMLAACLLPAGTVRADAFDMSSLDERYAIVVNADTPTEAYMGMEKNADVKCAPGSTTKILSCIVVLERANLDDIVTVSENAVDFTKFNSLMGLKKGDRYTLRDLLYGMMLPSGNDAAVAIAEHVAGSEGNFATMMNQKAQEIGLSASHFVTVHGKDDKAFEHYTTARDMAKLTAYALKNEQFRQIVETATYTATEATGAATITLVNSNRLIADMVSDEFEPASCLYADCIGVKTGDTNRAGKCFVAAAERGGVTLIAVLLGGTLDDPYYLENSNNMKAPAKDPYNLKRFQDAIAVFDYVFASMSETISLQELAGMGMQTEFETQVQNYAEDDAQAGMLKLNSDLDLSQSVTLLSPIMAQVKANAATLAQVKLTTVYAPVTEGTVIGTVDYIVGETVLFSCTLTASRSVQEGIFETMPTDAPGGGSEAAAPGNVLIGDPASLGSGVEREPVMPGGEKSGSSAPKWLWIVVVVMLVVGVVLLVLVAMVQYRKAQRKKAAKRRKQERLKAEARARAERGR